MKSTNSRARSIFPKPIFLSAAVRSPIGKFGGTLSKMSAPELAGITLTQCIKRAQTAQADFVFMGQARQAGAGPNPARQALIRAGLPESVPAITINQACASGLTSVIAACEKISVGKAQSIFAGGVECMSATPYLLTGARFGYRLGNTQAIDGMHQDGFFCPMSQMVMGETVEKYLAQELGISRADQDAYALTSQQKATEAWKSGFFKAETFPIESQGPGFPLATDEHMRSGTTLESLAKLPAVFGKGGSLTAGNSSGITDGAAFVHVSSQKNAQSQAEILDFEIVALDPRRMGLGPIAATRALLSRQGITPTDLAAVELNEAFAAQVLACQRELQFIPETLNSKGGAIAIGHPIGASGARILVTLIHRLNELAPNHSKSTDCLGLATLCISGGQGISVLIRALQ